MKTETQHTPGPWQAVKVMTHAELGHMAPPAHWQIQAEHMGIGATLVCELRPYGKDNDANAELIAQAPTLKAQRDELLVALEAVIPWLAKAGTDGAFKGCVLPYAHVAALKQARAAIAACKAGGKDGGK